MSNVITVMLVLSCIVATIFVKWARLRGMSQIWYSPVGWPFRRLCEWADDTENWAFRHAVASPFGITGMTFAVTHLAGEKYRPVYRHLDDAAGFIDAGTLFYGILAISSEVGGRIVFRAIAKRRQDLQNAQADLLDELLSEATSPRERARIRRAASRRGIQITGNRVHLRRANRRELRQ